MKSLKENIPEACKSVIHKPDDFQFHFGQSQIKKKILSSKILQLFILAKVQLAGIPENIKGSTWNYLFLSIN